MRKVIMIGLIVLMMSVAGVAFASSEGAEHAEGGEHGTKGWIATDTYRVMNFAVLAIAVFFIARKPASRMLGSRIQGIKDELEELEGKKKEAEKMLAGYNERIARLEQEGEDIIAQYVKQGQAAKEKMLAEAETTAEKMKEQARRNIDHEFKDAKVKLQREIVEKALLKAEELVKNTINPQDQERLVDEYLQKMGA